MTQIMEVETKIESLSQKEFVEIRDWILKKDAKMWDQKIEQDIQNGSLESMAQRAISEFDNKQYKAL